MEECGRMWQQLASLFSLPSLLPSPFPPSFSPRPLAFHRARFGSHLPEDSFIFLSAQLLEKPADWALREWGHADTPSHSRKIACDFLRIVRFPPEALTQHLSPACFGKGWLLRFPHLGLKSSSGHHAPCVRQPVPLSGRGLSRACCRRRCCYSKGCEMPSPYRAALPARGLVKVSEFILHVSLLPLCMVSSQSSDPQMPCHPVSRTPA